MGLVHTWLKPNSIFNPKLIFSIISYVGLKDSHHFKSCSSGHIRSQFLIHFILFFLQFGHTLVCQKKRKKKKEVWCNIWIIDISIENIKKCQLNYKTLNKYNSKFPTISSTFMQQRKNTHISLSLSLSIIGIWDRIIV